MQTRRLFAHLWRVNAVIIFVAGLLSICVLAAAGYLVTQDATRTHHVDNVANTALGNVRESVANLGAFEDISGTNLQRAPLVVHQTYSLGSGSKDAGSTRNYLYFDPANRTARWLRPSMDGLILESIAVPKTEYGEKERDVSAYVYLTVDADTDSDERLTASDAKQIAVSSPAGRNYRVLVSKADRINETKLLDSRHLLVLYSTDAKLMALEVDLVDPGARPTMYEVPISFK